MGLSYYGPAMGSDEYLSFFLSGLVELPGYMLCWAVMDRWGRRWPLCLLMVVGGLFCSVTVLMPPGPSLLMQLFIFFCDSFGWFREVDQVSFSFYK